MNKQKRKSDIIRDELISNPSVPSLTLAKMLCKRHPELFDGVERARNLIRMIRGRRGVESRRLAEKLDAMMNSKYEAPPTYKIEDGKWLILADIHIPFHSTQAIEMAINEGKKQKVNGILLLGDIVDGYQISSFVCRPDIALFREEKMKTEMFLEILRDEFPKADIIWKMGNHDDRILTYIAQHAPAIFDEEYLCWQEMLHLYEYKIKTIASNQLIHFGKLTILHGHEFGQGFFTSVNPARSLFLKTKACSLCAHHHQTSQHNETNVNEELITCWSIGCLCNLHPLYRPITKWNYGFAIAEITNKGKGHFKVRNFRLLPNMELVD